MPLPTSRPAHADAARSHAHADTIAVIVAVLVLAAAGIVGFAAFDSASARISGSTDNASNVFEAARIDLQVDAPEGLLFNADGLYPGLVVERCIQVALIGSADDIDIRLMSSREGAAAGLEQFVETTITLGEGSDPDCTDHVATHTIFDGRLDTIWEQHGDFAAGLAIAAGVADGFETTMRVTATLVDDDAAQGLTTDFWLTFEARP
jgi:hypothetical protein